MPQPACPYSSHIPKAAQIAIHAPTHAPNAGDLEASTDHRQHQKRAQGSCVCVCVWVVMSFDESPCLIGNDN